MFVIDVDQRGSRGTEDLVPAAMRRVEGVLRGPKGASTSLVLPIERTVGDEFQCLLRSAAGVIAVVRDLVRIRGWSVGVAVGAVEYPLPNSVRSARGQAFVLARTAVEEAKRARPSVAFRSPSGRQSQEISAYFRLLATLWQTRTEAGWEAIDAMDASASELTMSEVAPRMGITRQALSQRLQAAEWKVEREAIPLLERLLEEADRGSSSDQ